MVVVGRNNHQVGQHRKLQIEALQRISHAVSATLDLTAVLQRIISEIPPPSLLPMGRP